MLIYWSEELMGLLGAEGQQGPQPELQPADTNRLFTTIRDSSEKPPLQVQKLGSRSKSSAPGPGVPFQVQKLHMQQTDPCKINVFSFSLSFGVKAVNTISYIPVMFFTRSSFIQEPPDLGGNFIL